ncbi:glycosyltransferase family 4 protein [Malikia granosa]|uniref:glycosyltransferase family 4 protein n=1 Tax=Malikia granosa TaxID=263067 RepID=UPI0011B0A668|nr:glycosyltransferase family 4 protein [Malikia granosa]
MAKVALIALNNINLYPAFFYIAEKLSRDGHEVTLLSRTNPLELSNSLEIQINFKWIEIKNTGSITRFIPLLKGNSHGILGELFKIKPDWVIGQHQYSIIGVIYKIIMNTKRKVKAGIYFSDYIENNINEIIIKKFSRYLDLCIDVCDLRVQWRITEWPKLQCKTIVVRQATPVKKNIKLDKHCGPAKIIFTGSNYGAGMNWELLGDFINTLCEKGILFDWYLPGTDNIREKAKKLSNHPNYTVYPPVRKSELLNLQRNYDFGLFWAPYSEETTKLNRSIYASAASNKICEYQSSGLGIIHTGNPGLSYLPENISFKINPWDINKTIKNLFDIIESRNKIEEIRLNSLAYHIKTMNSENQIEPLSKYIKNYHVDL